MLRLRLLGAVDLATPDGRALDGALRQPKRIAVLAYLAVARPFGFHRRDKVAALFWPELNDERARAALRTTLSRLRDDIGADVITTRGADEVGIEAGTLWCDVVALDAALAADDIPSALALYRGPFLDGVHVEGTAERLESWIAEERESLRQRLLAALTRAASLAAVDGREADAIALARESVRVAPTDEQTARRLISLHIAAGDRGSAAAAYDALATRMRREFELEPSEGTRALLEDARASTAAPSPPTKGPRLRIAPTEPSSAAPASRAGRRRSLVAAVAAVVALALLGIVVSAELSRDPAAARWQVARLQDGTVMQLTLPVLALDSTESGMLVGFGAEAFHPLRINPRMLRVTGLGSNNLGWQVVAEEPGPRPAPRWGAAASYHAASDRLFLAGGAFGTSAPCTDDVWWSRPASGLSAKPRWHPVETYGGPPPARTHSIVQFDSARRELVLYGGNDCFTVHFHDAWILGFSDSLLERGTWRRVSLDSSAGAPRALPDAAAVVDLAHDRILALNSALASGEANALWELVGLRDPRGARWRPLVCDSPPPARQNSSMVLEPGGGGALLFGGLDPTGRELGDLWRLTFGTGAGETCRWTAVTTVGDAPFPRTNTALFISRRRDRLLLFGGKSQQAALSDLWELPLTRSASTGSAR